MNNKMLALYGLKWNPRALMIMAAELLEAAPSAAFHLLRRRNLGCSAQREARQIDETLFSEVCAVPAAGETKAATRRRR